MKLCSMKNFYRLLIILFFASGCAVSKNYDPSYKYPPEQLQEDYKLFRGMLEESHPSLYWYTPKDTVDYYFNEGARRLNDSLPEYKFRYILSYVLSGIKFGHPKVRPSASAYKFAERIRGIAFPLGVKTWGDTVIVTSNMNRKDSNLIRGVLLQSIDGKPVHTILDSLYHYLSADGYNTTHKYQTLSNPGVFRSMYVSIYGFKQKIPVEFVDTAGNHRTASMNWYN